MLGTDRKAMDRTVQVLQRLCSMAGAELVQLERFQLPQNDREVAEAHVRLAQKETVGYGQVELRVAFLGDTGVGKSTLLGVLAHGHLDNGQGRVRVGLFRHRHEILSGHTSSVAIEPLVLMNNDESSVLVPVRHPAENLLEATADGLALALQRRYVEAPKVLQLFDLPGRPRWHRSSLATLTSVGGPDVACLLVKADGQILETVDEYAAVLAGLGIPLILVLSMVDLMAAKEIRRLKQDLEARYQVPVLPCSAISGEGVDALLTRLIQQEPLGKDAIEWPSNWTESSAIFAVENVRTLKDVGIVLKGAVLSGSLVIGPGLLGPTSGGAFVQAHCTSQHRLRVPVETIGAGLMASVAVSMDSTAEPPAKGQFLLQGCTQELIDQVLRPALLIPRPPFIGSAEGPLQGLLVLNGFRHKVIIEAHSDGDVTKVWVRFEEPVFLLPGLKYVLVTHLGLASGIVHLWSVK